jgi:hypothetical protein
MCIEKMTLIERYKVFIHLLIVEHLATKIFVRKKTIFFYCLFDFKYKKSVKTLIIKLFFANNHIFGDYIDKFISKKC